MSELELQQEFRASVLRELEHEKTILNELNARIEKLERTVVHGNGHPALTVQVKELEVKVDTLSKDMNTLRDEMSKIDDIRTGMTEIRTELALQRETSHETKTNWWAFAMVIATVVGTALLQRFLPPLSK